MAPGKSENTANSLWIKLTGNPEGFSMENRAFNYVSLITIPLLIYYLTFDLFIGQYFMSCIIIFIFFVNIGLYYLSRYKKRYQLPIIIYSICAYIALIFNFYVNSGITGSTLLVFFLTFHLIIAIGKPKHAPVFVILHIGIVSTLLYTEFLHPDWVLNTIESRGAKFLDIGCTYATGIVFIYAIINYLRTCFNNERIIADTAAKSISAQNELISAQNILLEKVNAEKDKIFSIVSHDLKSPIDSILNYLELLSEAQLEPEEKSIIEAELLDRTKNTSDMMLNLLLWAKAQMSGVTVRITAINLFDLADKAIKNKKKAADKKGIKLSSSVDPSIAIMGDQDMMQIIIRNLINNAIKFTMPGGAVCINAEIAGPDVVNSVTDNGIGIADDKKGEIFTVQSKSTYGTNNEKGIGLGLKMCNEFVQYQQGKIWFESNLGTGSVFYISLPQSN